MLVLEILVAAILGLWMLGVILQLAFPLPPHIATTDPHFSAEADTQLGRALAGNIAGHAGLSGVLPLYDGRSAFAARVLLARAAERAIDVQYYMWRDDLAGRLLIATLVEAADRGVRVRLLLDDNGTAGMDELLSRLDAHPLIEVRLFNPFVIRRPKVIGYLMDFRRLNYRMHNKSFTVDNAATIVGGRNVGDEYFDARDHGLFADLDVMAVGPVVLDVADDFDRYWNCVSAYPLSQIVRSDVAPGPETTQEVARVDWDDRSSAYAAAVHNGDFVADAIAGRLDFEWAPVRMVSDDPAKVHGRIAFSRTLAAQMYELLDAPKKQLGLVSAYFVPTKAGTRFFSELAASGVEVRILTNSYAASDVAIVHAGYVPYRRQLLKAGVRLFEMCGDDDGKRKKPITVLGSRGSKIGGSRPTVRASGTVLHAKTFAIDGERLFIGSFNFDPRSMHLNTEMGFIIESTVLATQLQNILLSPVALDVYEVQLAEDGRMQWVDLEDGRRIIHHDEPGTTVFSRAGIRILSWLPIEWML